MSIKEIQVYLSGKKTYITTVLIALFELLKAFEVVVVTPEQNASVLAFLGVLLAASVRAAIKKSE